MKFRYLLSLMGFLLISALPFTAWGDSTQEYFQEWTHIDVTGPLGFEKSDLRFQTFFENRNQETRVDFAVGYRVLPLLSFWQGFTWISPNNGISQFYRPWQQMILEFVKKNPAVVFQTRTRFEEVKREGYPELLLRFRERWRLALIEQLPARLTPVIYEEIFINVNNPQWVNAGTIDLNRAFIGVDTPSWKNSFFEFGYINQYRFSTPIKRLTHILAISFMVVLP